jgi:hypothetical protein
MEQFAVEACQCSRCSAALKPAHQFCPRCGLPTLFAAQAEPIDEEMECPTCGSAYPPSSRFCKTDGTKLVSKRSRSRPQSAVGGLWQKLAAIEWRPALNGLVPAEATRSKWLTAIGRFLSRYRLLLFATLGAILLGFLMRPIGALLVVPPVLAGWIVALSSGNGTLRSVKRMDRWFLRAYDRTRYGGRIRRWVFRPLFWLTDNWNAFASRAPDEHIFAALRVFGYVGLALASVALIALLAYIAVVIVLSLLAFWLALRVIGWILDSTTQLPGARGRVLGGVNPLMGAGRRGRDIHRGKGGWFGHEEKAGRVDRDGNIHEGRGGWFGHEEKIGRIDEDGTIYEGKGGWFYHEEKVGRRDANGDVYEGEGGLFGHEEKIGRVDDDGTVYRGPGGWFGREDKIGRSD